MEGFSWYANPWHEGDGCCVTTNQHNQGNCSLCLKNSFIVYIDDWLHHGGFHHQKAGLT